MSESDIENDLQRTVSHIAKITAATRRPGKEALTQASLLLAAFVARHRLAFSFENFPLPAGNDDVMATYELNDGGPHGPALSINAIHGGVSSVVHDHGTWAVIVGIEGVERHCIYRRFDGLPSAATATLRLECEATVCEGQPLILEEGLFHSIHTDTDKPALQLHLYGQSIDTISGRQIVDLDTGQIAYLSEPNQS